MSAQTAAQRRIAASSALLLLVIGVKLIGDAIAGFGN